MSLLDQLCSLCPKRQVFYSTIDSDIAFAIAQPDEPRVQLQGEQKTVSLSNMMALNSIQKAKFMVQQDCFPMLQYETLHKFTRSLTNKLRKHYYCFIIALQSKQQKPNKYDRQNQLKLQSVQNGFYSLSNSFEVLYIKHYASNNIQTSFQRLQAYSKKLYSTKQIFGVLHNLFDQEQLRLRALKKLSSKLQLIHNKYLKLDLFLGTIGNSKFLARQAKHLHEQFMLRLIRHVKKALKVTIRVQPSKALAFQIFRQRKPLKCKILESEPYCFSQREEVQRIPLYLAKISDESYAPSVQDLSDNMNLFLHISPEYRNISHHQSSTNEFIGSIRSNKTHRVYQQQIDCSYSNLQILKTFTDMSKYDTEKDQTEDNSLPDTLNPQSIISKKDQAIKKALFQTAQFYSRYSHTQSKKAAQKRLKQSRQARNSPLQLHRINKNAQIVDKTVDQFLIAIAPSRLTNYVGEITESAIRDHQNVFQKLKKSFVPANIKSIKTNQQRQDDVIIRRKSSSYLVNKTKNTQQRVYATGSKPPVSVKLGKKSRKKNFSAFQKRKSQVHPDEIFNCYTQKEQPIKVQDWLTPRKSHNKKQVLTTRMSLSKVKSNFSSARMSTPTCRKSSGFGVPKVIHRKKSQLLTLLD